MALFGNRHYQDDDFDLSALSPEDLFKCRHCDIEFRLKSDKIIGKTITCPVCKRPLKAWYKRER